MPKQGYKKAEKQVLSTAQPSPLKTRSGLVRNVNWSPQVDLQNAIKTANENLKRMSDEANPSLACTTPGSKVTPQRDNQEIPLNASGINLGASGDTTPRTLYGSILRRKLSLSGNNEDTVGATAKSPLDEEI